MFSRSPSIYRAFVSAVTASLVLAACASAPTRSPVYSAEDRLREDSRAFRSSDAEACLLVGTGAGLLAYFLTDSRHSGRRTRNALIAAAAGCGVGVGTNRYVQAKRTQYADEEVRLQAMIQDVRADNARLRRVVNAAREVVDDDRRRIEAIDRAYAQRRISLAEARAQMAAVDNNRAYLEQTLANLRQREREWRRVADQERRRNPGAAMARMDQEIDRLEKQIASLEYELEILVDRRRVSPVG